MVDSKRVTVKMPIELYKRLKKISDENNISVSAMLDFIVALYLLENE